MPGSKGKRRSITKYTLSNPYSGASSDVEMDGYEHAVPGKEVAQGHYDSVRPLFNKNKNYQQLPSLVLKPKNKLVRGDLNYQHDQFTRKFRFYTAQYPNHETQAFDVGNTYRLIVPHFPGMKLDEYFQKFDYNAPDRYHRYLKVLRAIFKRVVSIHGGKIPMAMIDLNAGNFLYDDMGDTCYAIDGGHSHLVGEPISSLFHCKDTTAMYVRSNRPSSSYPPEVFHLDSNHPPHAYQSMDMFALSKLFSQLLDLSRPEEQPLAALFLKGLNPNPAKRPDSKEMLRFIQEALERLNQPTDEATIPSQESTVMAPISVPTLGEKTPLADKTNIDLQGNSLFTQKKTRKSQPQVEISQNGELLNIRVGLNK